MSSPVQPESLWVATSPGHTYPPIQGDISVDVAVVGGGITGLTVALLLKRSGKTVALVERGQIGLGVTGHTTGHLTTILDTRYQDLIDSFGEQGAQLAAQASRAAIEQIASFVAQEQIDCDFRRVDGYLYTENQNDLRTLEKEVAAAQQLGVAAAMADDTPLPFPVQGAIRFAGQAQFHALAYVQGLARAFTAAGGQIFEQSHVSEVAEGEPCRVVTEGGTVAAQHVVVATHTPINDLLLLQTKIAPYRSYVMGVRLKDGTAPVGLFWDTENPYHYTRSYSDGSGPILIIGGEDHKTGQEDDTEMPYRRLETYVRAHFPVAEVVYRWSSQVHEPVDGLPYIGKNPLSAEVYVATGYAGNGLTWGTVAGMLISDQILGRENPWTELLDASRVKPVTAAGRFISEGLNVAARFVGDRFSAPDAAAPEEIALGEGKLVDLDGKRIAAYRDDQGALHTMSATCTHAGCIVQWNNTERSWDCPCHGGRFSATGQVIAGPPATDLAPYTPTDS